MKTNMQQFLAAGAVVLMMMATLGGCGKNKLADSGSALSGSTGVPLTAEGSLSDGAVSEEPSGGKTTTQDSFGGSASATDASSGSGASKTVAPGQGAATPTTGTNGGNNVSNTAGVTIPAARISAMQNAAKATQSALKLSDAVVGRSLVSAGDTTRLANVMRKAQSGQDITVGVIGGSITNGAAATDKDTGSYAALVATWWREAFPDINVTLVNAGVGSTDSMFGVHRADADLFEENPDFIIVEYGVNDYETAECRAAYESLVRRCLKRPNSPAVMLLFFMYKDSGGNILSRQDYQQTIGEYYKLPMISYYNAFQPEVKGWKLQWSKITSDTVHPTDYGHQCASFFVTNYLTTVYAGLGGIGTTAPAVPSAPKVSSAYENATYICGSNFQVSSLGDFFILPQALFENYSGWGSSNGGNQPLVLDVSGYKHIYIQYVRRAGLGRAKVTVNGTEVMTIDANEARTDKPAVYLEIANDSSQTKHIEITPMGHDNMNSFILLGFLASNG